MKHQARVIDSGLLDKRQRLDLGQSVHHGLRVPTEEGVIVAFTAEHLGTRGLDTAGRYDSTERNEDTGAPAVNKPAASVLIQ
jgi:hypothetical protein